jgi:hypothetical protein
MAGAQGNRWRAGQAACLRPQVHAHFTIPAIRVVDHLFRTGERIMMDDQAHEICTRTAPDVLLDPANMTAPYG